MERVDVLLSLKIFFGLILVDYQVEYIIMTYAICTYSGLSSLIVEYVLLKSSSSIIEL